MMFHENIFVVVFDLEKLRLLERNFHVFVFQIKVHVKEGRICAMEFCHTEQVS